VTSFANQIARLKSPFHDGRSNSDVKSSGVLDNFPHKVNQT
jgi:hypothetical protein